MPGILNILLPGVSGGLDGTGSLRLVRNSNTENDRTGDVRRGPRVLFYVVQPGDGGGAGPASAAAHAQCDGALQKLLLPHLRPADR